MHVKDFLLALFHNELLLTPFWAWCCAQILKTLIYLISNPEFNKERLVGDGGMPSSHSATVMALVTVAAIRYGAGSYQFAISAVMALIVMHDAMGVRRETGNQARVINSIQEFMQELGREMPAEERLKELVGHTPLQVLMGALLGTAVGLVNCLILQGG